jgi:hypothetical protein
VASPITLITPRLAPRTLRSMPGTWGPHTKLGFGSGIIVGLGYLGLSPPFIRADLRSIV